MIRVKLAAARDWMEIRFREGMRVTDVLVELRYHPASIALISLNGIPAGENAQLKDGDEMVLVPSVGGGIR